MNLAASRDDLAAALLAAGVHGFFLLLLVIGVSWQIHDPQPIMAELWQALPDMAKPVPAPEPSPPPPELKPEPVLKPEPKTMPKPEPDTRAADIALEKKKLEEKKKQEELLTQKQAVEIEKKKQQEAEKRRREEARLMELEAEQEAARLETDKLKREQEKKLAEQKRREALKREEEEMERRLLEEEANQAKAREAKVAADRRAAEIGRIIDLYKAKISDKVRGNIRLPENLSGNPEVVYAVNVLPTGEIIKIKLVKSSGNTAYDRAVETAIAKSSLLDMPPDREAAQYFRELELKHKAKN